MKNGKRKIPKTTKKRIFALYQPVYLRIRYFFNTPVAFTAMGFWFIAAKIWEKFSADRQPKPQWVIFAELKHERHIGFKHRVTNTASAYKKRVKRVRWNLFELNKLRKQFFKDVTALYDEFYV